MRDIDHDTIKELVRNDLTESNFYSMVNETRALSGGAWGLREAGDFVSRIYREKFGRDAT